jgi:hypothetical protein
MKLSKNALVSMIIVGILTSIILPITIIFSFTNFLISPEVQYTKGFQVAYDEMPLSEPIVILNPKGTNIFYQTGARYMGFDHEYILINYRTAIDVIAEEYILDGEAPQLMPSDNLIPTPEIGNHTLMLIGTNSTGHACNSTLVNFFIGSNVQGVCGAAPECFDHSYSSTVHFKISTYGFGLLTDTIFDHEIFLEGPEKPITEPEYTKNVNLTYEAISTFVPFIILRSELWYNHTVKVVNSHWVNLVSDGESVGRIWMTSGFTEIAKNGTTRILYFKSNILHVFGTVTYWNGETRYYDVISIEGIFYDNIYAMSYDVGEKVYDNPVLGSIDFSQFPGLYQDKNMTEDEFWEWKREENWLQSYGIESSMFLGNYVGNLSCPVPVQFSLPQHNIIDKEMIPKEIIHRFTRTGFEPENYDANYRGLENAFSMNIIPI